MKLALECSTALLELVQPFADFDFILAKEALGDEKYLAYYKDSTNWKIVDNSVNEEGEPVSIEDLVKVFEEVRGTYLVSPDWIGDPKKTLDAYQECIGKVRPEQVIGVPQGNTFEEAIENIKDVIKMCLEELREEKRYIKLDYPEVIGIKQIEMAV